MMHTHSISPEIVRKIRQIEIYTRRLLNGSMVGDSRSALKGTGFEFDQIREYRLGDDVRCIDWKASARANNLLVKQYQEERSREVFLVVDVSNSHFFGSSGILKREMLAQVASALALVADYGNDSVGLLLYTDIIEHYMPPRKGRVHARTIMETLFSYQPVSRKTSVRVALQHLAQLKKRNGIVFILSDFIDEDIKTYLPIVSRMYDCIAIRYMDNAEKQLPSVGFITVEDIETGELIELDTRRGGQKKLTNFFQNRIVEQDKLFKQYAVEILNITDKDSMVSDVVRFFRRRMRY